MKTTTYLSPDTRREYLVIPRISTSGGGYERFAYDVYLETRKVAECELTSQVPFTVRRFEVSS